MLCTMGATSLYGSVDTLPSTPDFMGHYFWFHPTQTISYSSLHNIWKIHYLFRWQSNISKILIYFKLKPLSSFPLTKNQSACRSVGKWRLGAGMTWQDISQTAHPSMPHRPLGFRSCVFIAITKKVLLTDDFYKKMTEILGKIREDIEVTVGASAGKAMVQRLAYFFLEGKK